MSRLLSLYFSYISVGLVAMVVTWLLFSAYTNPPATGDILKLALLSLLMALSTPAVARFALGGTLQKKKKKKKAKKNKTKSQRKDTLE